MVFAFFLGFFFFLDVYSVLLPEKGGGGGFCLCMESPVTLELFDQNVSCHGTDQLRLIYHGWYMIILCLWSRSAGMCNGRASRRSSFIRIELE